MTTNSRFKKVLRATQLDECGKRLHKRQKFNDDDNNKLLKLYQPAIKKKKITNF